MGADVTRILVAEDNLALAQVVRFNLEMAGYDVLTAHDGKEAWNRLSQGPVDLLITDHQMPRMTGWQLVDQVRRSSVYDEIPVIFLTAKSLELDQRRLQDELKVDRVFAKPFSPVELVQAAAELLAHNAPRKGRSPAPC